MVPNNLYHHDADAFLQRGDALGCFFHEVLRLCHGALLRLQIQYLPWSQCGVERKLDYVPSEVARSEQQPRLCRLQAFNRRLMTGLGRNRNKVHVYDPNDGDRYSKNRAVDNPDPRR